MRGCGVSEGKGDCGKNGAICNGKCRGELKCQEPARRLGMLVATVPWGTSGERFEKTGREGWEVEPVSINTKGSLLMGSGVNSQLGRGGGRLREQMCLIFETKTPFLI